MTAPPMPERRAYDFDKKFADAAYVEIEGSCDDDARRIRMAAHAWANSRGRKVRTEKQNATEDDPKMRMRIWLVPA